MGIDVRTLKVDGIHIWRDGRCKICSSPTFETDGRHALDGCIGLEDMSKDYYLWCSNPQCQHHIGETMYDTECPPIWANHDRS